MARWLLKTLVCLIQAVTSSASTSQPHVIVDGNDVYGVYQDLGQNDLVSAFLGIRYGQAPEGGQRFRKAEMEALPAVINATAMGPHCHPVTSDPKADEDCLFLNVYSPVVTTGAARAVALYIHGGGNILGNLDGRGGGPLVANGDVIVVTCNYRLGPFGFLSTMTSDAPGNMGFWDQNLALRWIHRYIKYFGGDPGQVTIFGESAGGKATSLHTVSPHSNMLFRRAVMLSGSIFGPSFYAWDAPEATRRVAVRVNCSTATVSTMVACLRQIPADQLVKASGTMWPDKSVRTLLTFGWGAVRDGDFIPHNLDTPGTFKGEVMMGLNSNEGSLLAGSGLPTVEAITQGEATRLLQSEHFKAEVIPQSLYQYFHQEPSCQAIDATYKHYITNVTDGQVGVADAMRMYADEQYVAPTLRYLREGITSGTTFLYLFDQDIPRNRGKEIYFRGANHAEDLPYLMGVLDTSGYSTSEATQELEVSRVLMTFFTTFVKIGNPNRPDNTAPVYFPAYDNVNQCYMRINSDVLDPSKAGDLPSSRLFADRASLWLDELPVLMSSQEPCHNAFGDSNLQQWVWTWVVLALFAVLTIMPPYLFTFIQLY